MGRLINKLTTAGIKKLATGMHNDGNGLYLKVTKKGGRSWIYRYKRNGKTTDMGLGSLADVTLGEARDLAKKHKSSPDPLASKRKVISTKFKDVADLYIERITPTLSNKKHIAQWASSLRMYVHPYIGDRDIDTITTYDIEMLLNRIWTEKNETASRVRGRMEKIFSFAITKGLAQQPNPAAWKGNLDSLLGAPSKIQTVKHHAALPYDDMPDFIRNLSERTGSAAKCLAFLILTASRTSEATGAKWSEIQGDVWVIPAARMKMNREHRVPLTPDAIAILNSMVRTSDFIFPSRNDTELSNMAMSSVLKRMQVKVTVHGFRSTFRDWIYERTELAGEIAEQCLAHSTRNAVEAAYKRGSAIERRRDMLTAWNNFILQRPLQDK